MKDCRSALDGALALFERAKAHLAGRDVDAVQMEAYDLAVCWAELRAASVALDRQSNLPDVDETAFEQQLVRLACAEAVANLRSRLAARPSAFGLESVDVDAAFVNDALSPESMFRLGETVRARQGRLPADGIAGDHALMRETFRRFAEEQVMPLAEPIHRQDMMIPASIIDGLRQLAASASRCQRAMAACSGTTPTTAWRWCW